MNPQLGVSSTWPTASTISSTMFPEYLGTCDADFDGSSQPVTIQPRMLVRNRSELGSREVIPLAAWGPLMDQLPGENLEAHAQLATAATKGKRKSTAPSSNIYTSANSIIGLNSEIIMTEPTKPMREMIVNDWVKKQKLAKTKVANFKGRGRKRRSLVVVLKLSRGSWTKWEEQKVEPDLVMKELVLRDGRVHKILVDKRGSGDVSAGGRCASTATSTSEYASGSATGGAEPKRRGRGRPRKNPGLALSDVGQEDKDEGEDEDEDELEVIPQPKERREGALRARKREAEAKEEVANAIENEKRARERAIAAEENARLKDIEDKENARLKAIEDEKRGIEKEKQRTEDERQRMAYEKKAVEEEKRRKEEKRLQAIENEKNKKEAERRRAYREAKMMATKMAEGNFDDAWGYDSEEEYGQEGYQEEDQEMMMEDEQVWDRREKCWWELELPGSSFAVAIGRRPGYHWKTQYITEAELAMRTGEPNKPIISTPTSTTKAAKTKKPLANTRNTRKSTAYTTATVGDTASVAQSHRKSALKATTTTKTTTPRRRTVSSDLDPDDEFITRDKWSLNKKQAPKAQAARRSRLSESTRDGLRERRAITKYSDAVESFEHDADWSADIGINDDGAEAETMSIKDEDEEAGEGYDDRWKRGGRRRVW